VLLKVPAGKFQAKGSGFAFVDKAPGKSGTDKDGTNLVVYQGQKSNGAVSSAIAGTIKVAKRKGALNVTAKLQGLDLGALSGAGTLVLQVGPYTLTANVTLSGNGKVVKIG
jgi:hypothetical protein